MNANGLGPPAMFDHRHHTWSTGSIVTDEFVICIIGSDFRQLMEHATETESRRVIGSHGGKERRTARGSICHAHHVVRNRRSVHTFDLQKEDIDGVLDIRASEGFRVTHARCDRGNNDPMDVDEHYGKR